MTKTAIDIDRPLADEARRILGTKTLTATVNQALQEIVNRQKREGLIEMLINLSDNFDESVLEHAWGGDDISSTPAL